MARESGPRGIFGSRKTFGSRNSRKLTKFTKEFRALSRDFAPFAIQTLSCPSRSKRPPRRTIWITKLTKTHEIHERVSRPFASFRDLRDPNALPAEQSGSRNSRKLTKFTKKFRALSRNFATFAIQTLSCPSRSKRPPRRTIWITKDTKTHEIHERVSRPFASFRALRDPDAHTKTHEPHETLSRPFARFRDLRDPNALPKTIWITKDTKTHEIHERVSRPFASFRDLRDPNTPAPSIRKDRAHAPSTLEKRLPLRATIQRHHPRLH